jgi:Phosphotransferase enzyme family
MWPRSRGPGTLEIVKFKDQASMIVELLAKLHATFWERRPGWVCSASGDHTSLLTGSLLNTSAHRLAERTSIPVEDGGFIIDNYRAVAKVIDNRPNTVMHGDAHPGNVYFRNGEAGLLDWQAVRRGHGRHASRKHRDGRRRTRRRGAQRSRDGGRP